MKILFITPYSSEGASNRYRVEQYLPYLKRAGFEYRISPFVSSKFYEIIYKKGNFFKKIFYFFQGLFNRMQDVIRSFYYDIVFIHREACPFGPPLFEWLIHLSKKPMIFDFDDSIFLENFSPANSFYRFFKFPSKTGNIIKMSKIVIVANMFLKKYAVKFNENVYVIPTCVDTEEFNRIEKNNAPLVIGWIGSATTAPYLNIVYDAMQELSKRYDFIFKIVGAGENISISGVKIENYAWQLNRELRDFQSLDIGLYPLPDNLWTQGKAGFKAIQYMAVGIPVVASSVGMIKEIIQDGVNGFLAATENEWVGKISMLIERPSLRHEIGSSGRKTVVENFSVKANMTKYLEIIKRGTLGQ